jgi:hypothetical protein
MNLGEINTETENKHCCRSGIEGGEMKGVEKDKKYIIGG